MRIDLFKEPKHWHNMTNGERVLYISYLACAEYRGEKSGIAPIADMDMAVWLGWSPRQLYRYKNLLKSKGYITTAAGVRGVTITKYNKYKHMTPTSVLTPKSEVMSEVMSEVERKRPWYKRWLRRP